MSRDFQPVVYIIWTQNHRDFSQNNFFHVLHKKESYKDLHEDEKQNFIFGHTILLFSRFKLYQGTLIYNEEQTIHSYCICKFCYQLH